MIFRLLPIVLSLWIFLFCGTGWAIEVAPPISDREIIDKLARLEEGQKGIRKEMDQRFESMENSMNQRFESMENSMNQRFEAVNQRFTSMENYMSQMFILVISMIIAVLGGMFGLIGFIIWDRKTALHPLEKKLDKLEQDVSQDLELQRPEDSRVTRLIYAIREIAQEDSKVAKILKSFSLL